MAGTANQSGHNFVNFTNTDLQPDVVVAKSNPKTHLSST